ncbi:MAG: hypothetical protein H7Z40_19990 [Phycisphaerae bacterium]|nr:hypothetical protein [Gemmatimonadaceae bacterium]
MSFVLVRRGLAAALLCVSGYALQAQNVGGQTPRISQVNATVWKDSVADSLISRAILLRRTQLADSTLLSYRAKAHGFLAFLAQFGDGYIIPPKVVQSEELALTLAWWQPGRSAQQLVGRRDTTLLPADVGYYRDRYAVVLDNLPDRVRLGDGFDVADVPHPLSADAATRYEYRRGGGFQIGSNGRNIVVDEVEFRPRDLAKPGAIGSVYLDRETGAVVRLSMTFTRAAILDKRIETLVVTLINGLISGRYWLPTRQEVEVARSSTWLEIPVRGIVRGHWEISGYEVNEKLPALTMSMPRWSSVSLEAQRAYKFDGVIADMLPSEMRLAGDEDVVQARKMAEAAVRAAALAQPRKSSAYGRGISDLVRFNRTEGLAAGLGFSRHWGDAWQSTIRARYGFADRQVKGRVTLGRAPALGGPPVIEAFVERDYRDVAPPERSGVANSIGALFGSDFTTQVDTYAAGFHYRPSSLSRFTLRVAGEVDEPLTVRARPVARTFAPALPAWTLQGARAEIRGGSSSFDTENPLTRRLWSVALAAGAYQGTDVRDSSVAPLVARVTGEITFERAFRNERLLVLRTVGGFSAGKDLPPQWLTFAGGPNSAPGYSWSSLAGRLIASQRLEFRQPIPAPAIPLGKFGRAPGRLVLAPYVQATALHGAADMSANRNGVYPSVGLGGLLFFDLLRFDIARDLRNRRWSFGFDIDRGFWGVL